MSMPSYLTGRRALCAAGLAIALLAGAARAQVYSTSPNLPISDPTTVQSTIHVTGGTASVTSLHVIIKVQHTYDSDLDIVLVHGGRYLLLSSGNGADGDNYLTTRFTDSGVEYIYDGDPP